MGDRQGGDWAGLGCNVSTKEVSDNKIHKMPDDIEKFKAEIAREPDVMPYFFMQQDAYCEYMRQFVASMNESSKDDSSRLCDLSEACSVLEIADSLTEKFKRDCKAHSAA